LYKAFNQEINLQKPFLSVIWIQQQLTVFLYHENIRLKIKPVLFDLV